MVTFSGVIVLLVSILSFLFSLISFDGSSILLALMLFISSIASLSRQGRVSIGIFILFFSIFSLFLNFGIINTLLMFIVLIFSIIMIIGEARNKKKEMLI